MNTGKRKQDWARVEELMNQYFKYYDKDDREKATTLLWELTTEAFVQHVRRKGATTGYAAYQPVGWAENPADDGWEATAQSLLASVFNRNGAETLMTKYQDYRDNEGSVSFQRWMVRRLWWRMQARWAAQKEAEEGNKDEKENEKKKKTVKIEPAFQLSAEDVDFDMMADERDPAEELVKDLLGQARLEEGEKQVLDCFCDGLTRKEAADHLNIGEGAYRYRLEAVFEKLRKTMEHMG